MKTHSLNTFKTLSPLKAKEKTYEIFHLGRLEKQYAHISRWPLTLKIFLENLLRHEDGRFVRSEDIRAFLEGRVEEGREIYFMPARVLMQDFTGVPAIVDLAAMRAAVERLGRDPRAINPLIPVDLVIDHSVQVDFFGSLEALRRNEQIEFERNRERYRFLRWGQEVFGNLTVVPPGTGIVHQINLEHTAKIVWTLSGEDHPLAFPDTVIGTDSHTTMINGLGVLGWGVGGIEAEAAMLGQPLAMSIPDIVGFKLTGRLPSGTTATDAVLTVTQILRARGVVGKFVEFFGPGLSALSLADRATIANMCPEYGATAAFFPPDRQTLEYLKMTGRSLELLNLVQEYGRAQGLFCEENSPAPEFKDILEFDLSSIEPSLAGPRRPQDRIALKDVRKNWDETLPSFLQQKDRHGNLPAPAGARVATVLEGRRFELSHGAVVIAAITSCTNTSNPSVMVGAALLAKKAVEQGLEVKPWVKTSLAPGSKVVAEYLRNSGLLAHLEELGFHLVGYGCTTCIGNSGPLPEPVSQAVKDHNLVVAAVLSGNRNFEGRIHPQVKASYLASPPLVVAYALAGSMTVDLNTEPLGLGRSGSPVFLRDIWPTAEEIQRVIEQHVSRDTFSRQYADVYAGDEAWKSLEAPNREVFDWEPGSTYIKLPPYFEGIEKTLRSGHDAGDIRGALVLAVLGDSVTTDHISPAGSIPKDSPAGRYLLDHGVAVQDFNSYGARRGNHELMVRGTFANIRLRNLMVTGSEGGVTLLLPEKVQTTIYEASVKYRERRVPLVVLAGKEYGSGSSRDWAAKGPALLGVRAVIAQSFERIHRSNLVGMGILPFQFAPGESAASLGLTGLETLDIAGISGSLKPRQQATATAVMNGGSRKEFKITLRLETPVEVEYYRCGGILPFVLCQMFNAAQEIPIEA
ncbi:MAG: aconitate hydratase AcnA [Elusimicrobia bacterium]|nr:aconitate hydratase AcnA [Elusimicrobiota bacterium]